MTHVVFFGAYVYFLCTDIKRKQIDLVALAIYAVAALITVGMSRDNITMARFMDLLFSFSPLSLVYTNSTVLSLPSDPYGR